MRRKERECWQASTDIYACAVAKLSKAWAEAEQEKERVLKHGQMLYRAYTGIRYQRDRLLKENKLLKARVAELEAENLDLNSTLDTISATKNQELIGAMLEVS